MVFYNIKLLRIKYKSRMGKKNHEKQIFEKIWKKKYYRYSQKKKGT